MPKPMFALSSFTQWSVITLPYGSADHAIHYIDLRSPGQQLFELKGHQKTVSYVRFISTSEVISASTDSELKLWNVKEGQVLRTYRGHTNHNNFVGLTVSNDFISCGSNYIHRTRT